MEIMDKAFVINIYKIKGNMLGATLLTQNNGRITGMIKSRPIPMITAFGMVQWKPVSSNIYIQFEQLTPSPIAEFIYTARDLKEFSEKCLTIESFDEFYDFLKQNFKSILR